MSGIEIDIEWVRRIANETRGRISSDAQSETQDFRDSTVSPGAIGTLPVSQQYASQVEAAHAFFTETIEGVLADLEDFATNLQASADAHETTDTGTADGITGIDPEVPPATGAPTSVAEGASSALSDVDGEYGEDHSYHSDAENQESASDDDLIVPDEATAQDSGSAADGAGDDDGSGNGAGSGAAGPGGYDVGPAGGPAVPDGASQP